MQPALFWGEKLFQQYVVDAWASIEQSMLNWFRFHQKELRADVYPVLFIPPLIPKEFQELTGID